MCQFLCIYKIVLTKLLCFIQLNRLHTHSGMSLISWSSQRFLLNGTTNLHIQV